MKKKYSPVMDIFPQVCNEEGFSPEIIRQEAETCAKLIPCDRMYCVVTNDGYPMFSSPWLAFLPRENNVDNFTVDNIARVGDGNKLFVDAIHALGKKAFAVFKPYEMGGGRTVAHGAPIDLYTFGRDDVGGTQTGYGKFLSEHPECAVKRFPYDDANEHLPINRIVLEFVTDEVTQRCDHYKTMTLPCVENADLRYVLYVSDDNGTYKPLPIVPKQTNIVFRKQKIKGLNGRDLYDEEKRVCSITLTGFSIENRYIALGLPNNTMHMIPQVMVHAYSDDKEVPTTIATEIRESRCPKGEPHVWGNEGNPYIPREWSDDLDFLRAGFEFDWHGGGFWGDGWQTPVILGIGRGKRKYMRGTPCEGEPLVREYWLDVIDRLLDMGYDGIDLRLQNHSGMVSDWTQYGWNEPIQKRYAEMFGQPLNPETVDPLDVMRVRGSLYMDFVREAAEHIHAKGKILQLHLRESWEHPTYSHEFNELAFWAMPKVLPDWREAVDIADEITLKDYHHNRYQAQYSQGVKQRCAEQGKPVWIHLYIQQGNEMNEQFISDVERDDGVYGVLLYEATHSGLGESSNPIVRGIVSVHGGKCTDDTRDVIDIRRLRHHMEP